jgi:predicted nucleic acid-binding protein
MIKPSGIVWVVLDTNILVSSLLSDGPSALIVDWAAGGKIRPCFDDRILSEYWDALKRPKFGFSPLRINRLIRDIVGAGFGMEADASSGVSMSDEGDRKFYDVAKTAGAILITGNARHYPDEPFIVTPAAFVQGYYSGRGYRRCGRGWSWRPNPPVTWYPGFILSPISDWSTLSCPSHR